MMSDLWAVQVLLKDFASHAEAILPVSPAHPCRKP